MPSEAVCFLLLLLLSLLTPPSHGRSIPRRSIPRRHWIPSTNDSPVYLWPLPKQFNHGDGILCVDPDLSLDLQVPGDYLEIVSDAFERYKDLIFTHWERSARRSSAEYDVAKMTVIVSSTNDTVGLQFGVDESYMLYVGRGDGLSVVKGATIEANTIYGALRGLENVLHWHILDEESFPLEVPSYPNLWKGSYSKLERYTIEDAYEVVDGNKHKASDLVSMILCSACKGIHIMAEVDVPGHAESWGSGYPDLWPSANCTEPLDVSKNFTFEVISGILSVSEYFCVEKPNFHPIVQIMLGELWLG
ncbi:hypothetical protein ZIOFF_052371 [Zingiber officinale]|uniref:beta-N-acetylhexosaminidase n=1 Tax=Zingiber officinale TaxID=94328 RepID=A0A8J5FNK3_ZINOF|nr:hypothetical protein ZIOFF_052371 [Zingiber officinale]